MAAPTAPTGFAASVGTQTLTSSGWDCDVTAIQFSKLQWNATALGGAFLRYEIQRSESGTFVEIARLISEAIVQFDDYETPRGELASYRMRVVNQTNEVSTWTSTVTATPDIVECEWLFVSNSDGTLNVGYVVQPSREYTFPDSPDVVFKKLWGRDYQVAFQPLERRGVQIALNLVVSFSPTTLPGVAAFDQLRAITTDPSLAYVCVLDPYGNRFFAKVQMPKGTEIQPGGLFHTSLTITEVTATPYAPQITLSQNYNEAIGYNAAIGYNS